MRLRVLQSIDEITRSQMCTGCGACVAADPEHLMMVDDPAHGRRPVRLPDVPANAVHDDALAVCPGAKLTRDAIKDQNNPELIPELYDAWGPVLELWEGYAADERLRWAGSSGGGANALAWSCVAAGDCEGVLHIGQDPEIPILNATRMSKSIDELIQHAGSRYAPASPCDSLGRIENASKPCVFIGKPCDVAGANRLAALRENLQDKLGLTIGIFCAGVPSMQGTLKLLEHFGIQNWQQVESIRYRGNGWPGRMTAKANSDQSRNSTHPQDCSYSEGWGDILQKHRQWRCYICPDHTGEFADVAVGDPWYRKICEGEPGQSLFVIRTQRGREAFMRAMHDGHIVAERLTSDKLPASQPNLLKARGTLFGRLHTSRWLGAAAPNFEGYRFMPYWLKELSLKEKLQSFYGTAKRVFRKKLRKRITIQPWEQVDWPARHERLILRNEQAAQTRATEEDAACPRS